MPVGMHGVNGPDWSIPPRMFTSSSVESSRGKVDIASHGQSADVTFGTAED